MASSIQLLLKGSSFVCKENQILSGKRISIYKSVTALLCQKRSLHEDACQKGLSRFCLLRAVLLQHTRHLLGFRQSPPVARFKGQIKTEPWNVFPQILA